MSNKSSLYEKFQTDTSLEETGVWMEFAPGVFFCVRSSDSNAARNEANAIAKARRPKVLMHGGLLPAKDADELEIRLVANALVTGWRGVTDAEGKDLPYTKENLRRIITDLPHLRREIVAMSNLTETYKQAASEALEGNSPASSGTSSPSESTPSAS